MPDTLLLTVWLHKEATQAFIWHPPNMPNPPSWGHGS